MQKIFFSSILVTTSLLSIDFAICANCHGLNAEKRALGKSQIINGWTQDKIIKALEGYKYGVYGGDMKGIMKAQVTRLTDTDIKNIAVTISNIK